jgi:hypothetical protein
VGAGGGPIRRAAIGIVLERPVLVHLPLGLGPRRRAAKVEHHGLLHTDGTAVVGGPGRARRLPVTRRRRPAGSTAPRLPLLPRAEEEPRLPLPGAAAQPVMNLCTQGGMPPERLKRTKMPAARASFGDTPTRTVKGWRINTHGYISSYGNAPVSCHGSTE